MSWLFKKSVSASSDETDLVRKIAALEGVTAAQNSVISILMFAMSKGDRVAVLNALKEFVGGGDVSGLRKRFEAAGVFDAGQHRNDTENAAFDDACSGTLQALIRAMEDVTKTDRA
jgi:hypothetical protein